MLIWKPGEDFSGWTALLGGASAIFFAICVFCAKEAARAWSPIAVTCVHSAVGALTLLILFRGSALPPIGLPVLWVLAGGLVSGLIANILFNQGMRHIPTSATGALTYLEPLTATVLGWLVFHEALGPWGLFGGILVLAIGVWVATEPRTLNSPLPSISDSP